MLSNVGALISFFKLIGRFIVTAAKIVYRVLKLLKVRLLALWLFVSAILALCGVFKRVGIGMFWVGVGLCGAITLLAWGVVVYRALVRRKVPREREEELAPAEETPEPPPPPKEEPKPISKPEPRPHYPLWFNVAGNPNYFFAEYEDRYELYYRGPHGAEYVRTDYKREVQP